MLLHLLRRVQLYYFSLMDYILLIRHFCSQTDPQSINNLVTGNFGINSVEIKLLNPTNMEYLNSTTRYENLQNTSNLLQFNKELLLKLTQLAINYVNVRLIAEDINFFSMMQQFFFNQNLSIPLLFLNYLDWQSIIRSNYQYVVNSIPQAAKILCGIQKQSKNSMNLFEAVILKIRADGYLLDTDHPAFIPSINPIEGYKFYKCLGLPYKITLNQAFEKIVEPSPETKHLCQMIFVYQNGRFSGKAVLKVPQTYKERILKANKMYIGKRYVQIQEISQYHFQKQANQIEDNKHKINNEPKELHSNSGHYALINNRNRRDKNSSSSSHSFQRHRSRSPKYGLTKKGDELTGVRIRGLPYSFSEFDIENLFEKLNFKKGTVKIGHKNGRRSGQAMILFQDSVQAFKSLQMNGITVMNRYLELKTVSSNQYDRFY